VSCGWNLVCWALGDPAPDGPRKRFDAAVKDLQAARARGDKPAIQAALARMQKASQEMHKASNRAIKSVAKVDKAVASVKRASIGFSNTTTMALMTVVLLAFITRK